MTKHTSRDEVWNHALRCAITEGSFELDQVHERVTGEVSSRTVRDTLNTMVSHGWLAKDSLRAHEWRRGAALEDAEKIEARFDGTPPSPSQEEVAYEVDTIENWRLDRISNSANLVIEKEGAGHLLGSHGPIEEYVNVPYKDGKPIYELLPRLHDPRVVVCREEDTIHCDDTVDGIILPTLRINDVVPVDVPLLIEEDSKRVKLEPEDLDGIPTPLFGNVDKLKLKNTAEFDSWQRHTVEVRSIDDEIAYCERREYSNLKDLSSSSSDKDSSSSSNKGLDKIAEEIGTVTHSPSKTDTNTDVKYDARRKELLSEVASTYD